MSGRPKLTLEEAQRAIYLDFEGRKGEKPAVLGTLWATRRRPGVSTRQYILDEQLARADLPGVARTSLSGELGSLIRRCRAQDRLLVGWSTHEVGKVRDHAPELGDEFDALYRDAKSVARSWRSRLHRDLEPLHAQWQAKHRLATYADWTGCLSAPAEKRIADTIAKLRRAVGGGRSYGDLPDALKVRWQELLAQNLEDCAMTRCVALRVLSDLENIGVDSAISAKRSGELHRHEPAKVRTP